MCSLSAVLCSLHRYVRDSQPLPLDAPVHFLQPGDFVLVRTWKDEPLQEKWKGPYLVLLVSHTAAKVEGHKSWIPYSRLKAVPPPQNPDREQWTVQPTGTRASEDLGFKLLFKCK
uniref:Integrase-type domain-containing protein n=1 Tax=Gopherus agassizii TaxID=38772 RepID=A0A452HY35_9SAUR